MAETTWRFSTADVVEIQTPKEMGYIADVMFERLSRTYEDDDVAYIGEREWQPYFKDLREAKRAFIALFHSNAASMNRHAVTRDEFIGCLVKAFKARMSLSSRLQAAKNVYNLVKTLAELFFWIIMCVPRL